ncbi:hypothetical protein D3C83_186970 [compost metagenome]
MQVSALGERVGLDSPWVTRSRDRMRALESSLKESVILPDDYEEEEEDGGEPPPLPEPE